MPQWTRLFTLQPRLRGVVPGAGRGRNRSARRWDRLVVRVFGVPAAGPHGLSLLRGERLFCVADNCVLVTLHRDTGTVNGAAVLSGEPGVIMHDASRPGRISIER